MEAASKTVRNERTKLTATMLNGIAIASIAAGVVTPLAALTFGFGSTSSRTPVLAMMFSLAWLFVGAGLHLIGRWVLGRLWE